MTSSPAVRYYHNSEVYKYNGGRRDNTILHRQKRLLSFQNDHFLYFLTIKVLWFEE